MLMLKSKHRLLCGDSTNKDDVDRLMDGAKADMVFTDPPYGINLDTDKKSSMGIGDVLPGRKALSERKSYKKIEGDDKPYDPSSILEYFDTQYRLRLLEDSDYQKQSLQ